MRGLTHIAASENYSGSRFWAWGLLEYSVILPILLQGVQGRRTGVLHAATGYFKKVNPKPQTQNTRDRAGLNSGLRDPTQVLPQGFGFRRKSRGEFFFGSFQDTLKRYSGVTQAPIDSDSRSKAQNGWKPD